MPTNELMMFKNRFLLISFTQFIEATIVLLLEFAVINLTLGFLLRYIFHKLYIFMNMLLIVVFLMSSSLMHSESLEV